MKNVIRHWKTTVAGLIVAIFTGMLWRKSITVEEWIAGIGAINTVILLFSKDPDNQ